MGTIVGLTVMLNVANVEHCPEVGVKVYVVVAWLFKAGDHVPLIPFKDEVGSALKFST